MNFAVVRAAVQLLHAGADVIVLITCRSGFPGIGEETRVPIVKPAWVALGTADQPVRSRLRPGKLAYPTRPKTAGQLSLGEFVS